MKIKILQSKRVYMKFTEMIFIQLQVNKMVEQAVVAMMIMMVKKTKWLPQWRLP